MRNQSCSKNWSMYNLVMSTLPSISFCISTNRNLDRICTIKKHLKQNLKSDFEILVFSTLYPGPGVKWIKEKRPSKGGCLGQNVLSYHAQGDLVCMHTDDIRLEGSFENCLKDIVNDTEEYFYSIEHRTSKFSRAEFNNGVYAVSDPNIAVTSYPLCNPFTKKLLLPMVSKKLINEKLGGMINNVGLYQHYVDSWLGVWAYWNGVKCKVAKDLAVHDFMQITDTRSSKRDCLFYQNLCTFSSIGTPYQIIHTKMYDKFVERYKGYIPDEMIDQYKDFCSDGHLLYEGYIL